MNPDIPSGARRVKVSTDAHGQPGVQWLEVHEILGGNASRPIRAVMPNGEIREFGLDEVEKWED